jgi:hypothetical protein
MLAILAILDCLGLAYSRRPSSDGTGIPRPNNTSLRPRQSQIASRALARRSGEVSLAEGAPDRNRHTRGGLSTLVIWAIRDGQDGLARGDVLSDGRGKFLRRTVASTEAISDCQARRRGERVPHAFGSLYGSGFPDYFRQAPGDVSTPRCSARHDRHRRKAAITPEHTSLRPRHSQIANPVRRRDAGAPSAG